MIAMHLVDANKLLFVDLCVKHTRDHWSGYLSDSLVDMLNKKLILVLVRYSNLLFTETNFR